MLRAVRAGILVLLAFPFAVVAAPSARAFGGGGEHQAPGIYKDGCTNRDFEGPFGFLGAGTVLNSPVNGLAGPFARVGRLVADGAGTLFFSSRATFNGISLHQDFGGTYSVKPDCTYEAIVTLPFTHPSIEPFTVVALFTGVITDGGRETQDLFVNPPGVVIYGKGRQQRISRCTNADFQGSFLYDLTGFTLDLGFPLPSSSLGRLEVDGRGKVGGRLSTNTGGFSVAANLAGSYTVAPDCTFEVDYCALAENGNACVKDFSAHGVLFDAGAGAYLVVLKPEATTLIGILKRQ